MIDEILSQGYAHSTLLYNDILLIEKHINAHGGPLNNRESISVDTPETVRHCTIDYPPPFVSTLTPPYTPTAPIIPQYEATFIDDLCNELDLCNMSFPSSNHSDSPIDETIESACPSQRSASSLSVGTRPCDVAVENIHIIQNRRIHAPLYRWLQELCHPSHIIAYEEAALKTTLMRTVLQMYAVHEHAISNHRGHVLIIAPKNQLGIWETTLREYGTLKFHSYTESLAKRRKMTSFLLTKFDVVLTTFGIIQAKEVALPLQELETHRRLWKEKRYIDDDDEYMKQEMSNMHLLHWDRVIIDQDTTAPLRIGTAKGNLLRAIDCDARTCLMQRAVKDFEKKSACKDMMSLLGLSGNGSSSSSAVFKAQPEVA